MTTKSHDTPADLLPAPALSALLLGSYRRVVGQPLAPTELDDAQAGRWLYEDAPFCVLAHNTEPDPVFIYANKAAQRCFEYSWAQFVALPSRLSAEAPNRAERQRLLDQVTRSGFAGNYTGVRISGSGRRFFIENATVWQLLDDAGVLHGQGAMLPQWRDVLANQPGTSGQADAPGQADASSQVDTPNHGDTRSQSDTPNHDDTRSQSDAPNHGDAHSQSDAPGQSDTPNQADARSEVDKPNQADAPSQVDPQ